MADGASGTAWEQQVAAHYLRAWGRIGDPRTIAGANALCLPTDFTVLAYPPSNLRPYWTYATCGMSQPQDAAPIELFMLAPYSAESVVELLFATAHFHRSGANLALGDAVNFGRPWMGASLCTFGLVSLPHLDGPGLGEARLSGREVRVHWLLPITPPERAFRIEHGLAALEAEFERAQLQFVRPGRESVV